MGPALALSSETFDVKKKKKQSGRPHLNSNGELFEEEIKENSIKQKRSIFR